MSAIVESAGVPAVCARRRMPGLSAGQPPSWRLRAASVSRCTAARRTRPRRRRSRARARPRSRGQRLARLLLLLDPKSSCGRAEDSRAAVVPADTQTRRLLGDDLLHDASPRRLRNALGLDHDPVSRMRFHGITSFGPDSTTAAPCPLGTGQAPRPAQPLRCSRHAHARCLSGCITSNCLQKRRFGRAGRVSAPHTTRRTPARIRTRRIADTTMFGPRKAANAWTADS